MSSHLLNEVQAVCTRILIINQCRIIADEKASNLLGSLGQSTKIKVKVSGPQKEVYSILNSLPGVTKITESGIKEGDSFTFLVESKSGIDIRKPMFNALAKKNFPIMGLENTEGELEDVFVKLIDSDKRR